MPSTCFRRGLAPAIRGCWAGAILAVVAMVSCPAGEAPVRLRLAMDLWAGYYPAFLAAERGQFAAVGLVVDIELPQDTKRSLAELAAGEYDAVAASLSDFFPVFSQDPGARLVLLSDESAGGDAILSRIPPAADVAQRREAMRGKRIGTNLGGFGEILVRRWLSEHQLSADDVQLMQMDASDGPKLLATGGLDFVHTWNPYIREIQSHGGHRWFDSSQTPGLIPDGVVIGGAFMDRHPDLATKFVQVWMESQAWWLVHPEEARVLLQRRLGADNAEADLTGIRLLDGTENRRRLFGTEADSLAQTVPIYNQFFLSRGLLNRPIDVKQITARHVWP